MRFEPRASSATDATNSLALLIDALDDEYEQNVVAGALAGAREAGATVLCVAGGSLEDPAADRAARNFVFDLVGAKNVSGILVLSSSVGSALGPARFRAWLERYAGVPLVSIGVPIAGFPSVQVDNAFGARAVITHLIRDHGKRRIAYIRGPLGSSEADVRVEAYRSALELEGIEPDPRWIADGDFTRPSGSRAIGVLLDERAIKPDSLDAIAAANDYMALGAIEELGKRGLRVPEHLAVVGFDDVDSARLARPALTTVRQPTELLGRSAARALAGKLSQRPVQESGLLPTELVPRTSCGCSSSFASGVSLNVSQNAGRGLQASFVSRRSIIVAELARAARGRLGAAGAGWETRLIDALLNELRGVRASFTREFERILRQVERSRPDGDLIQEVLSGLRLQSLPCVAADPVARDRLEEALHDARVFASAFGNEALASRIRHERDRSNAFQRALRSAMIMGAAEVSRVCAAALPEFGIEACVVAALSQPGNVKSEARVVLGFGPGGKLASNESIALDALPSHELLERSGRTQLLLPIVHGAEPRGVALISIVSLDSTFLEDLRDAFAAVLVVLAMKAGSG